MIKVLKMLYLIMVDLLAEKEVNYWTTLLRGF